MTTPSGKSSNPHEKRWHVSLGGKKLGPFNDVEMVELAYRRKLKPKSPVWKTGMESWHPCGSIPELAALFASRAPRFNPFAAWAKRIKRKHVVIAGVPTLLIAAVAVWRLYLYVPPHDDLVATFTSVSNGVQTETITIEKSGGGYRLLEKLPAFWSQARPARLMGKKEFSELFGEKWNLARPLGLVTPGGEIAVLKVTPGWSTGDFTCATGYFVMRPSGPLQLAKRVDRILALPSLFQVKGKPKPAANDKSTTGTLNLGTRTVAAASTATPGPSPAPTEAATPPIAKPEISPEVKSERTVAVKKRNTSDPDESVKSQAEDGAADDGPPPRPSVKASANRKESELETALREAKEARELVANGKFPGGPAMLKQYLIAGDQFLATSRLLEERGDSANALLLARRALKFFQDTQTAGQRATGAGSQSAWNAAGGNTAASPGLPLTFSASEPSQAIYKVGETMEGVLWFSGLNPGDRIVRHDTIMALREGRFVPFTEREADDLSSGTPRGSHTSHILIRDTMPSGSYRLHSEFIDSRKPATPLFVHDFPFVVAGATPTAANAAERKKGFLGNTRGVLEQLGVKVRVNKQ